LSERKPDFMGIRKRVGAIMDEGRNPGTFAAEQNRVIR
jgi:hypothetical protein